MASVGHDSNATSSSSMVNASKPLSSSFADTCSCRVSASSTSPRTCYECVNITLRSGTKCALAPNGDCVAEAKAIQLYQSQTSVHLNSSVTIYSSANSTYCERADAVCSQCRATWYQELLEGVFANSTTASPRVCTGSGGCVCLAVCEAFQQSANVTCVAPSVPTTAPAIVSPTQVGSPQNTAALGNYAWLIILFALFMVVGIWSYQQTQVDENGLIVTSYRERFRGKKRAPPRGPFLSLSGWLGYREKLIEEERAAMTDGKPSTLKKTLTQNGPDVTVQVGEGYRPASPSHVNR